MAAGRVEKKSNDWEMDSEVDRYGYVNKKL